MRARSTACRRADDLRSNMVRGGSPKKTELTPRERHICERLGPHLRERGLLLVGIDVIGDCLTEINVTSPTGIRAVKQCRRAGYREAGVGQDRGEAEGLSATWVAAPAPSSPTRLCSPPPHTCSARNRAARRPATLPRAPRRSRSETARHPHCRPRPPAARAARRSRPARDTHRRRTPRGRSRHCRARSRGSNIRGCRLRCITQGATFGVLLPVSGGAARPEKRVTARSNEPQKKCTGLDFAEKRARKMLNTRSACTSWRQKVFAAAPS